MFYVTASHVQLRRKLTDVVEAGGVEKVCLSTIFKWSVVANEVIKTSNSDARVDENNLEEFIRTCQNFAAEGGSYELIDLIGEFEKCFIPLSLEISNK
jgi:hypothetical protein